MTQRLFEGPRVGPMKERPYVAIPIEVDILDREEVATLVEEVHNWMVRKNLEPDGKPFCRYWVMGGVEEKFKVEVGIPTASIAEGDNRIVASFIPGGDYASALHHGASDYLSDTSFALEKWAQEEGLELDKRYEGDTEIWNGRFEFYPAFPGEGFNLDGMAVEIAYLLMRDAAA